MKGGVHTNREVARNLADHFREVAEIAAEPVTEPGCDRREIQVVVIDTDALEIGGVHVHTFIFDEPDMRVLLAALDAYASQ